MGNVGRKIKAGILIFDILLGLLLFSITVNRHNAGEVTVEEVISEDAISNDEDGGEVAEAKGESRKIALTFDGDVIIGLSQETMIQHIKGIYAPRSNEVRSRGEI